MKIHFLFSGGHVHAFETHNDEVMTQLVAAMETDDSTFTLWDESGEHSIGVINLERLEIAWVVE